MTPTAYGWLALIASLGVMAGLMAPEVGNLTTWSAALAPAFVGKLLMHFAAVIAAFVGGKVMPTGDGK